MLSKYSDDKGVLVHFAHTHTHTSRVLVPPNVDTSEREDENGMHYVCMACVNIQKANMPFVSLYTHFDTLF